MFAKWLEEYRRLTEETRFLSQLATFIISIFTLLSLYDIAHFVYFNGSFPNIERLLSSIIFQILIFIIFASRFVTLFFKTAKSFWLGQGLCLIGLILLASYWLVSRPPEGYYKFSPDEWIIFRYASQSLEYYGLWYLLLSPIRHVIIFVIALIKSK